jgi:hypothetical protein
METMCGSLKILPMLLGRVKIANQTDRDVILMVTSTRNETSHCQETSFCHLKTTKGNVILGLSGGDDHYVPNVGIWRWIVGRIATLSL